MDDFFDIKMMMFMKKMKIRLRNQNLKKKNRLRRYFGTPEGFYKI